MRIERAVRQLALGAIFLAASACATPTPYQAAMDGYGYSDRVLSEDRVEVTFHGNMWTAREDVERYLLYRAAEIADRASAPAFRVAGLQTEIEEIIVPDPCHSPYYLTYFAYSITEVEEEFVARAEIELLRAPPIAPDAGIFETDAVLSDLADCT
ncbi:hypothetical protein [Hyphomonas sp.]|jgi:hypothetical protein|uniref:CC0125/CC1285 family lipoprotein n=1 Tax=Hyphomonas sp. TaxID=87 RepID=UPI0032D8BEF2